MPQPPPMIGKLDVTLATLLVVERHHTVAGRSVTSDQVVEDVLSVVEHLELPPEDLEDIDSFAESVETSLDRLEDADWIAAVEDDEGEVFYRALEMSEAALAWICARLGRDSRQLRNFEDLDMDVTERVLADCADEDGADEDGADEDEDGYDDPDGDEYDDELVGEEITADLL